MKKVIEIIRKVIEIIGIIAGWIFGIIFILFGWLLADGYFGAGCFVVLTGLLMLPPIVSMIPGFQGKKIVMHIARCFVFIMAFVVTPKDGQSVTTPVPSQTNTATDLAASATNPEKTAVGANRNSGEDVKKNLTKKSLRSGLKQQYRKGRLQNRTMKNGKQFRRLNFSPYGRALSCLLLNLIIMTIKG